MVHNVHRRSIAASADWVGNMLDSLAGPDDRLWPRHSWPAMRLDGPLSVGAAGGHGPVRYVVTQYVPGTSITFRFTAPAGFRGEHRFVVTPEDGGSTRLDHQLTMRTTGVAVISWPLFFRPLHDALIEEAFDRVQEQAGGPPFLPARRSAWVRLLRWAAAPRRR